MTASTIPRPGAGPAPGRARGPGAGHGAALAHRDGKALTARLALREEATSDRLVDGAWWPRSWDLARELPALADVLDPLGGRITRVALSSRLWAVVPSELVVNGQPVRVHRLPARLAADRIVVMSHTTGRWNLLVVPPLATALAASRLMTAAGGAPYPPRTPEPRPAPRTPESPESPETMGAPDIRHAPDTPRD